MMWQSPTRDGKKAMIALPRLGMFLIIAAYVFFVLAARGFYGNYSEAKLPSLQVHVISLDNYRALRGVGLHGFVALDFPTTETSPHRSIGVAVGTASS